MANWLRLYLIYLLGFVYGKYSLEDVANTMQPKIHTFSISSYELTRATHRHSTQKPFFNEALLQPGSLMQLADSCSPMVSRIHRNRTGAMLMITDISTPFRHYRLSTLSKIIYAEMNGYFFYLYTGNNSQLPQYFTPHYFRVPAVYALLKLGHPFVLYADRDTFITPNTAVRLETFLEKDVNVQLMEELCSCALLFNNSAVTEQFLSAWWDLGFTKCCSEPPQYEQRAFNVLIKHWLGVSSLGNQNISTFPEFWQLRDISKRSGKDHVHLIGEGRNFTQEDLVRNAKKQLHKKIPRVGLVSNMGTKSYGVPALLYHTASFFWKLPSRAILEDARKWLHVFRLHKEIYYSDTKC